MTKRFSRLKWGIKQGLRKPGTGEVVEPGADTVFANYKKFLDNDPVGTRAKKITLTTGIVFKGIRAFQLPAPGNTIKVSMSKRSADFVPEAAFITALNLSDPGATFFENANLIPAKATIKSNEGAYESRDSNITGASYRFKDNESYTYPLGNNAASDANFSEVRAACETALDGNFFSSYDSELLYKRR